jgi:hypothetical protein
MFRDLGTLIKHPFEWVSSEFLDSWFGDLEKAIRKYPILAQVSAGEEDKNNELDEEVRPPITGCLLAIACDMVAFHYHEVCFGMRNGSTPHFDEIKELIEANPNALFWYNFKCGKEKVGLIIDRLGDGLDMAIFDLFLYVAEKGEFEGGLRVFDCPQWHDHSCEALEYFLKWCAEGYVACSAAETFFRSQPQLLNTLGPNNQYAIHRVLEGFDDDDISSLVDFMVTSFPASLMKQDDFGRLPLHYLCKSFNRVTENLGDHWYNRRLFQVNASNCMKVSTIFVERCSQAVRQVDVDGHPPLKYIQSGFDKPIIQDAVLLLLKAYYPSPLMVTLREVNFIKEAYDMLKNEEAPLARNCIRLKTVSKLIEKFMQSASPSSSMAKERNEINQIYSSWANNHLAAASKKSQENVSRLKEKFPQRLEGDDAPEPSDSDDASSASSSSVG